MGMGWIGGLKTRDCEGECRDKDSSDGTSTGGSDRVEYERCQDECYASNRAEQPDRLYWYFVFVYMILCPLYEVLCAVWTWRFPIRGERLDKLHEIQGTL